MEGGSSKGPWWGKDETYTLSSDFTLWKALAPTCPLPPLTAPMEGMSKVCGSWREPHRASPCTSPMALISSSSPTAAPTLLPPVLDQNTATWGKSRDNYSSPSGSDQQSEAVTSKPQESLWSISLWFPPNNMTGNGRGKGKRGKGWGQLKWCI